MQRSSTYVWGNLMQFHSTSGLACRASRLQSGRRSGRPSSCGSLAAVQEPHAAHRDVRQVDTPEVHAETLDVWSGIFMRQFSIFCRHGGTFTVQRVKLQLTRRSWAFTVQRVSTLARMSRTSIVLQIWRPFLPALSTPRAGRSSGAAGRAGTFARPEFQASSLDRGPSEKHMLYL